MPSIINLRTSAPGLDDDGYGAARAASAGKYAGGDDPAAEYRNPEQPLPLPPFSMTRATRDGSQGDAFGSARDVQRHGRGHGKREPVGGELHPRYSRYEDEATREDEDQAMASRERLDEAARGDDSAANDVERPGVRSIGRPNYRVPNGSGRENDLDSAVRRVRSALRPGSGR